MTGDVEAQVAAVLGEHDGWNYVGRDLDGHHVIKCRCGVLLTLPVYGGRNFDHRAHVAAALASAGLLRDERLTAVARAIVTMADETPGPRGRLHRFNELLPELRAALSQPTATQMTDVVIEEGKG